VILPALKNQLDAFFCALKFLTVIPCPRQNLSEEKWQDSLGLSVLFYPLVGLVVGLLLCLCVVVFNSSYGAFLPSVILLTIWVLVSGGLHLDGLADCADAWMGGLGSKEKTLAIMKDPACGTIAVLTLLLTLLLKLAAIEMLLRMNFPLWYWVLPPMLGRLAIFGVLLTTPYIRSGGIGEILSQRFSRPSAIVIVILVSLSVFSAGLFLAIGMLASIAIVVAILRALMCSRLGGCTGDTLGACVEFVELTALLVLCVFLV